MQGGMVNHRRVRRCGTWRVRAVPGRGWLADHTACMVWDV